MRNPLAAADDDAETQDLELVRQAQAGDREALEQLVTRHQAWIYNIALRMVYLPEDAEDVTQEILIKVLTKLSTFEGRSRFSTWLYRVAVRHILNLKRGKAEAAGWTFSRYGESLDATPDMVNTKNPCRCARKTQGFAKAGYLDPQKLLFARARVARVRDVAAKRCDEIDALDAAYGEIHRGHPFLEPPDFVAALRTLLDRADFKRTLEL